ncbi:hypothetical protein EDC01DRAFT_638346 [Geopyxis carbonaria]|nr:hypothetical protein EDC01DRAFT_638346 [Geopyxis carbonaria]
MFQSREYDLYIVWKTPILILKDIVAILKMVQDSSLIKLIFNGYYLLLLFVCVFLAVICFQSLISRTS